MTKHVTAILLIVVLLFSFTYSSSEKSFEEMDKEFDDALEQYKRAEAISKVFDNGLKIYPENGWEAEYAFDSLVDLPEITEENEKDYIGTTFLLTGTCVLKKGFGCVFQLEDGRKILVNFDIYDNGEYTSFFPAPSEKTKCNLYCTFKSWHHDVMYKTDMNFIASVTETAVQYCKKHGD